MATNAANASKAMNSKISNAANTMYGWEKGGKQTVVVLLIVGAILILVLLIFYIVTRVKKNTLQSVVLNESLIQLDNAQQVPFEVKSQNMSLVSAGHEFSYSFWIYLGSNYQTTADHKIIMARGILSETRNSKVDYNTNPVFFMDKTTNKMYIAVSTNQERGTDVTLSSIVNKQTKFLLSTIDYVPLQRWVHICLTVRDNSVFTFMDGDLYSAATVSDVQPNTNSTVRPIIRGTNGNLIVGNRVNNTNGFIAMPTFYNYALTQSEIENLYKQGPYRKSYLSYLGLGNYGLRTPVYKLDA